MFKRLREILFRARWEQELTDEIRYHLESLEEEYRAKGMDAAEARIAARREFGAVEPMKERYREGRGIPWLETLWRDCRYGTRLLVRSPGFTLVAVLTLALGLGANTAIYTVVHAVLLRTMPVDHPEELVAVRKTGPVYLRGSSYRFYKELRERREVFQAVAASGGAERNRLSVSETYELEQVWNEAVSNTYFDTLGVRPAVGRLLIPSDETAAGANAVAVLSHDYWRTRFAGQADVIGRRITLNDVPLTVVGVASPGFRGLDPQRPVDVWYPLTMLPNAAWMHNDTAAWLMLFARRAPGVTPEQVAAAVSVIWSRYISGLLQGQAHPWKDDLLAQRAFVEPAAAGVPELRREFERPLGVLMGIVALVLLIACVNVGNLLIARGAARARELNLRLAVGATRGRLLRQMFTESLLLAVAGATAGLFLASGLSHLLVRFLPFEEGTLPLDLHPDARILGFTSVVAVGASLLFGLLPAWRILQDRPVKLGLRRGLVTAQVCLSLVVLAGAGLFLRTLAGLRSIDPGFQREHVLTFWLDVPHNYEPAQSASLVGRALEGLATTPGITSASAAGPGPFRAGKASRTILVHGVPGEASKSVDVQVVTTGYFRTLRTPLIEGRFLEERDRTIPASAVLVNEAFVQRYLAAVGPVLGRRIGLNREKDGGPYVSIAGVVRNTLHQGLRDVPVPEVYIPMRREEGAQGLSFQVRGEATVESVRRVLREVDPAVAMTDARLLEDRVEDSLARERMLAALCTCFAGLALLLAGVGLYGVVAFSVSRRTREIGIRMAIGAPRGEILRMVIEESLVMIAWGTVLGLPAAFFASRLTASLLYGVKPGDPATLLVAALILAGTGAVAALIPARRAASIEPSRALRYE